MAAHVVKWLSPAPLWQSLAGEFESPSILRFESDSFMEEFLALLERDPTSIKELCVEHETWREPVGSAKRLAEPIAIEKLPKMQLALERRLLRRAKSSGASRALLKAQTSASKYRLKLYQPAHQRYYLVTSSLVCATAGFPDRWVSPGNAERASFVLRRLLPKSGRLEADLPDMDLAQLAEWQEHAFVTGPGGPRWEPVAKPEAERLRVPGEEPLPLFPVGFEGELAVKRRLLGGVIPVARREAYLGAPVSQTSDDADDSDDKLDDPRLVEFQALVVQPWRSLVEVAALDRRTLRPEELGPIEESIPEDKRDAAYQTSRESAQTVAWYMLSDFRELLGKHGLSHVLRALETANRALLENQAETDLYDALHPLGSLIDTSEEPFKGRTVATSFGDALKRIAGHAENLDKIETNFAFGDDAGWPPFRFVFNDPAVNEPLLPEINVGPRNADEETQVQYRQRQIEKLATLIGRALPPLPAGPQPAVPAAAKRNIDPRDGWFVIRCVYERPECGPLHASVVSLPTQPFQLAGFFDPDAPARPIRIGLPIDPTPAGLRKFDKKTFVMVSDILCGHIDRVKGLSLGDLVLSVLPWPFHKDLQVPPPGPCKSGGPLGLMCTLSLPIITICALILLMIMVSVLDMIFRWIPYFIMCFPLPGFKAKPK